MSLKAIYPEELAFLAVLSEPGGRLAKLGKTPPTEHYFKRGKRKPMFRKPKPYMSPFGQLGARSKITRSPVRVGEHGLKTLLALGWIDPVPAGGGFKPSATGIEVLRKEGMIGRTDQVQWWDERRRMSR